MEDTTSGIIAFTSENLINEYQNEKELWQTELNASEENKHLAWRRLADVFNVKVCKYTTAYSLHVLQCTLREILYWSNAIQYYNIRLT